MLYSQLLFFDYALYFRDIYHNYFAFLDFISRSLHAGDLPLWNPFVFAGTPQLAGAEPPIFYPLGWIFFVGLPFPLALSLNLILHHLLAATGVYLLGRTYGWSWFSASLSASFFSFSGVMISMNNLHPLQNTVAWLPLVFWAAHRLLMRQHLTDLAVFAGIYGLQVLSGHLEIVYVESLLLLAYGAALLWRQPALRRWRLPVLALGAGLLALGLSAVQLLPSIAYLPDSVRQIGLDQSDLQTWSYHPGLSPMLLLPDLAGNSYEGNTLNMLFGEPIFGYEALFLSAYLGVLAWALVLCGLSAWRRLDAQLRFAGFGLMFVFSLLLAFGKFTPLHEVLLALPGAGFFRYPAKLLVFAAFAFAMAAGCICQEALTKPALLRRLMLVLGLFAGLALMVWTGIRFGAAELQQWVMDLMQVQRPDIPAGVILEDYSRRLLYYFVQQLLSFAGLSLLLLGLIWLLWRRGERPRLALALLLLAANLDLLASGVNTLWMADRKRFEGQPELVRFLQARQLAEHPQERLMLANEIKTIPAGYETDFTHQPKLRLCFYDYQGMTKSYSLIYGFRNLHGFWPALSYGSNFLNNIYDQAFDNQHPAFRHSYESLGSARYVLAYDPSPELMNYFNENPDYRQLKVFPELNASIWENRDWLPRARFQYQAMIVEQPEQMIAVMNDPKAAGFDLKRHVLLLDDERLATARRQVPAAEAAEKHWSEPVFTLDRNNVVELSFETNTSGYLVLADQNLPGWKAYDNGLEVPILRADYLYRAVRVGPGPHHVRFEYHAPGFAIGAATSGASLVLCLGLLLWGRRRAAQVMRAEAVLLAEPRHV